MVVHLGLHPWVAVVSDLSVVVQTPSQIVLMLRVHALFEQLRRISAWVVVLSRRGSLMVAREVD